MSPVLGLHAGRYTSPEFARLELESVLLPSWQFACHVSDLPASGTALRVDFAGRTAVVLRGRDDQIRAFANVCRHRGSRLVDGDPRTGLAFCVAGRLRCPYHGWEYDDTGALVDAPAADLPPDVDRGALGLAPLRVESWLGFVFVSFGQPARPVAEMLEAVRGELQAYRCESLRRLEEPRLQRCQANWKLLCEHRLDTHHLGLARPIVKPRVGGAVEISAPGDDVLRLAAPITAGPAASWSVRAYVHGLPEVAALPPERRRAVFSYFVWPSLVLDVYPDQIAVTRFLPGQPDQVLVRSVSYALPDARREMRIVRYLNRRVASRAAIEDRRIVERVQAGLATGEATQSALADDETGLRWFVERLRRAVPAARSRKTMAGRARRRPAS